MYRLNVFITEKLKRCAICTTRIKLYTMWWSFWVPFTAEKNRGGAFDQDTNITFLRIEEGVLTIQGGGPE